MDKRPPPDLPREVRNLLTGAPATRLKALVDAQKVVNDYFELAKAELVRAAKGTKERPGLTWEELAGILRVNRATAQRQYGQHVPRQLRAPKRKTPPR